MRLGLNSPVCLMLTLVAALTGCSQVGISQTKPLHSAAHIVVDVPLSIPSFQSITPPTARIKLGSGPALKVAVDTGSSGLLVFQNEIAKGSVASLHHGSGDTGEFADGTQFLARLGQASVSIGGIRSSKPVTIGVISQIACVGSHPTCPGMAGVIGYESASGLDGILGIAPGRHGTIYSPLSQLPEPYASSYSVELGPGLGGQLILGSITRGKLLLAHSQLSKTGTNANGTPSWNPDLNNLCWSVGSAHPSCFPTLLDTGSADVFLPGRYFGASARIASTQLPPGTRVRLYVEGSSSPVWDATAGANTDGLRAFIDPTLSEAVSGMAIFFDIRMSVAIWTGSVSLWER